MESVFACFDQQESGKFWTSCMHTYPIMSIEESAGLYQGDLFIRRDSNVLKKRHFVGNEQNLYYLKVILYLVFCRSPSAKIRGN